MNIAESARHLGSLRAVESECFSRLGRRAPELTPASFARWAASASRAHAWRASVLEDLLPVSAGLPGPAELTVLPDGALADELERCLPDPGREAGTSSPSSSDSRPDNGSRVVSGVVGGLYPLLASEYRLRLGQCSPAADGATARGLRRALADLEDVMAEGSKLCETGSAPAGRLKPVET